MELVGGAEIAMMLNISRQRVYQLARERPDFPKPIAELIQGKVWRQRDIERWAERYRTPGPRKPRPPK